MTLESVTLKFLCERGATDSVVLKLRWELKAVRGGAADAERLVAGPRVGAADAERLVIDPRVLASRPRTVDAMKDSWSASACALSRSDCRKA